MRKTFVSAETKRGVARRQPAPHPRGRTLPARDDAARQKAPNTPPSALTPDAILDLQRTVGNRAVLQLLRGQGGGQPAGPSPAQPTPVQAKANQTGLPERLKAGIEHLSGLSMDGVKVHYNSPRPAELQALAYTQGTDIHLGPAQEAHLPHEAWHVVQQSSGRVNATLQLKDVQISDDPGLEREADLMGRRAANLTRDELSRAGDGHGQAGPTARRLRSPAKAKATVQRQTHGAIATLIHHAPQPALGNTEIDGVNKEFYKSLQVLASRRGELQANSQQTFDWDFASLASRLARMRRDAGIPASKLPIVVNANWMISPGYERNPREYQDQKKAVFSISSVWGFKYHDPELEEVNYATALAEWKKATDHNLSQRNNTVALGANASKLLRTHAKDKVKESPNDAIPHRGLRNIVFKDPDFVGWLQNIEEDADYVHVINLDSDTSFGGPEILNELSSLAEDKLSGGGLHLTATDYVYERDNVFEWFAGALDKVGRKKLEMFGFDAYPAEPGLTVSYASKSGEAARGFLKDDPFGPEYSGDPREGGFKDFVESRQSVEGKNIREKWRRLVGSPNAPINRTLHYLKVVESEKQIKGHAKTLVTMTKAKESGEKIASASVQTLITADNYHSLTPDRNSSVKQQAQSRIVEEATVILNKVLKENEGASDSVLKEKLDEELRAYMMK